LQQFIKATMDKNQLFEFRETLRVFEREVTYKNQNGCCYNVTLAQCHVLMELERGKNSSINKLSTKLNLDKSTISRTIDGLVKKGLVLREIPEENRRETRINLTSGGVKVCDSINGDNNNYYKQVLSVIPKEQLSVFMQVFKSISKKMETLNKK